MLAPNPFQVNPLRQSSQLSRSIALVVLALIVATLLAACGDQSPTSLSTTTEQRDAAIVAIAQRFDATHDAGAAQLALQAMQLADAHQTVLALAETYIAQSQEQAETLRLIALAETLGPLSRIAEAYRAEEGQSAGLRPAVAAVAPTPTPLPTDTPAAPTATPTTEPTATPTDTATAEAIPTATPDLQPRAVAASVINVRSGPGTVYGVSNQLAANQPVSIVGRNADRTWWQVDLGGGSLGWVAANVVDISGSVDAVALAENIPAAPTPRPTNTPAPVVVAPNPPTATPKPAAPPASGGGSYALVEFRLRPVGSSSQRCDGGDHNIFVKVIDGAGNPLDGVRVKELFTNTVNVTGAQGKGSGRVEWDIYRDGGGVVQVVDDNNNPLSPETPGMSANWPSFQLIWDAGYCNCKPHPDAASCQADLESHQYLFAVGHYVYEVTFQRR